MANTRRQPITIDHLKIPADVTYMPVLLTRDHLDDEVVDPSGGNAARTDGGDVRIYKNSDQTGEIAREIVNFEHDSVTAAADAVIEVWAAESSLVWSTVSDTVIYWTYGDGTLTDYAVTDPYGRNAVWADYEVVTHDGVIDSTGSHTRTTVGTPTTTTGVFGTANGATYLNNSSNEAVQFNGLTDVNAPYTIQSHCKVGTTGDTRIVALGDPAVIGEQSNLWSNFANTNAIAYSPSGVAIVVAGASGDRTTNVWRHYTGRSTTTTDHKALLNGGSRTGSSTVTSSAANTTRLSFGISADSTPYGKQPITIAESRLRRSALSDDWLLAEYNNQSSPSTFATAGTPVAIGGATDIVLTAGQGTAPATGLQPTLTITNSYSVIAGIGAGSASGLLPIINIGVSYYAISGQGGAIGAGISPSLNIGISFSEVVAIGTANAIGLQPNQTIGGGYSVIAGVGTSTAVGIQPTSIISDDFIVVAGSAQSVGGSSNPNIILTGNFTNIAGMGQANANGLTPTMTLTTSFIGTLGQAIAQASGILPSFSNGSLISAHPRRKIAVSAANRTLSATAASRSLNAQQSQRTLIA